MCVIIYIPKNENITKKELKQAWETNPDGAGYMIKSKDKTMYQRGFMNFDKYWKAIKNKIGRDDIILHLRISTSRTINQTQTHPYKKGNLKRLQGITDQPVICMNGSIYYQREYDGMNDTMSYIKDHQEAFKVINQDILNIIASDTSSRWAVMKEGEVILSNNFKYYAGKYYSNLNHLHTIKTSRLKTPSISKDLKKQLQKPDNLELYYDYLDFRDIYCKQGNCFFCNQCITTATTPQQLEQILYQTFYY